jgi:putative FmdB family regulatory protein
VPRYHYECQKCGHGYDLIEGWDAKPQKRCPECRGKAIRIPKAPAIVFKGKGFYSSDNRSSSFESRRKEEEGAPVGDGGKSDTKADGKTGATDGASATPASTESAAAAGD